MNAWRTTWVAAALGVLLTARPAWTKTIWVDGQFAGGPENGSPEAPFRTIAAALAKAAPGDTVAIGGGVYRESLRLPSGEPGRPITIRAADGQRVVLSGSDAVRGWRPLGGGLWAARLAQRPANVLLDGRRLQLARLPAAGWWRSASAAGDRIGDPANLRGLDAAPSGGEVYVWLQRGNIFKTLPIQRLDTQTGVILLDAPAESTGLSDGDKYWLQNRRAWIRRPGQWAVERDGDGWLLIVCVERPEQLANIDVPRGGRSILEGRRVRGLRIEGLELRGGARDGVELTDAEDVAIRRCVAYENGRTGFSLRHVRHGRVDGCVAWRNRSGVSISDSDDIVLEHNDVAYNDVDGVLVTWKSRNVTVRRNCSHHHLLWGHPDNVQTYRDVENLAFEDNLLLAGGQSVMMEQTRNIRFEGNMIVGSDANMLIFGHGNAGHAEIVRNTLAFSGYSCMSLTWEDYRVRENVFMTGHGRVVYGVRGVNGYQADRNLFWGSARAGRPRIMATDAGWLDDWEAVLKSTGQDVHSQYADPRFRSAPIAFAVLDHRRLTECSREQLYLRDGVELFRAGDRVELDFDGVLREVTAVADGALVVRPPLDQPPIKTKLVANWGAERSPRLDLRLREDSPGWRMSEAGGPIGSQVDIQAYLAGDFDGDGRLDRAPTP